MSNTKIAQSTLAATEKTASKPTYTRHAWAQLTRRGIKKTVVELITSHGDRESRVGGNLIALSLSDEKIRELLADDIAKPEQAGSLSKITILLDEHGFEVVTAFARYGKKSRHYGHDIKYFCPNSSPTPLVE